MEAANTVIIVMSVLLGIVLIFGVYKLATSNLSQHRSLTPEDNSAKRRQALKTFLYIFFTILVFLAAFVTYHIFTNQ